MNFKRWKDILISFPRTNTDMGNNFCFTFMDTSYRTAAGHQLGANSFNWVMNNTR